MRSAFFFHFLLLFPFTCLMSQAAEWSYQYDNPDGSYLLPEYLEEISGLSPGINDPGKLLAIQDELGKVFTIDAVSGAVVDGIEFWKKGDYEGIQAVDDELWVVKSTGTLYQIKQFGTPQQAVEKFNTLLKGDNDVEGLAYDAKQNRLLLACKRDAKNDGNDKNGRYIFAFDLNSKRVDEQPALSITRKNVISYLEGSPSTEENDRLLDVFDGSKKFDLSPSALAVHPLTGNLYLTCSKVKIILVLSPTGVIKSITELDEKIFPQPEGLTFSPEGQLFISTEAKGGEPARLYQFNPIKK